jgi:carbon-monoxide dehydrogenase small subunit
LGKSFIFRKSLSLLSSLIFTGIHMEISIKVNGKLETHSVESRTLLVDFLRDTCGLTGTRTGCDTSQCGCCTVLLDGRAIKSCTHLAVQADGHEVLTIEGLGQNGLHPVQKAFTECHALQCGYCTSGMIMSSVDLLERNPNPSDQQIADGLEGNICRCTGYLNIIEAVKVAAKEMNTGASR